MTWLEQRLTTIAELPARTERILNPLVIMPFVDINAAVATGDQLSRRAGQNAVLIQIFDHERRGFIPCVNAVMEKVEAPYVSYVAQDAFAGRNWLARGLHRLHTAGGGLLAFNDGKWDAELAAFGLADRTWAGKNYNGSLFYPGYRRHFADVELSLIARRDGAFVRGIDCLMIEVDPAKDGKLVDEVDRSLFHARCSLAGGAVDLPPELRSMFV